MRLNPGAFNAFLGAGGPVTQELAWRRAYACPCTNPASGAALATCKVCSGKGRVWDPEINGFCGLTAQTPAKMMAQFGSWEPGDAVLSIPENCPFYAAGWFDRFRAVAATAPFSINLTHGSLDRILATVVTVSRVFWVLSDQTTIVEGDIPDFDADGNLTWAAGDTAPPAGSTYSVTGVKYTEYFAYRNLPANRNIGITGLPLKLPVRQFDLFGR